jgi:serine/threonine-protein kinase GIN4
MRGKWLGSWKMSKGIEKMLHRMIQPNADVRCTAAEALGDPYWVAPLPVPKKAASSGTPDKAKPRNVTSAKSSRQVSKGQPTERKRTERRDEDKENTPVTTPNVKKNPARQRVLSGSGGKFLCSFEFDIVHNVYPVLGLAKRRPDVNAHMLTPLRQKENVSAVKKRSPQVQEKENTPVQQRPALRKQATSRSITRKPSALGDRTVQTRNAENSRVSPLDKSVGEADKSTGSVRNRMREWELERARLREMERVGESDNQQEEDRPVPVRKPSRLRDNASPVQESPSSFCAVTAISTDTLSSPTRSDDPFPRSMSAKLFHSIKESTAPPTSMRPLPGKR